VNDQHALLSQLVPFLLSRGYAADERAPSERELANRFRASRSQVREALSVLEALRLIDRRPKSGIYMTPDSASIEALALFTQVGVPLTKKEISEIIEVRQIQEIEAVRLACARRTPEDIRQLRECLDESAIEIREGRSIVALDRVFHATIAQATQNNVLCRLLNIFNYMSEERREYYFRDPACCRQSHATNQKLFEAIEARDQALAVDLLTQHLARVESHWRALLPEAAAADAMDYQPGTTKS